jgi:hypothetical protein
MKTMDLFNLKGRTAMWMEVDFLIADFRFPIGDLKFKNQNS